jgi:uroporphyrin-III C-methyltransferase/precorrin-2 dehydrogenase/sirohydrochlorin ferrochelatase
LATALGTARDNLRARFPEAGDRRRALDAALGQGGVLDPLDEGSAGRVADWLDGVEASEHARIVEITIASDDPEDLTIRTARLLGSVDVLAHEPGIAPAILNRARADAVRIAIEAGAAVTDGAGLVVVLRR